MSRITLQDVRLSLGGKPILENITWSLQPGQHWGILGANGSGKSTFMKLLRGDLQPDQRDGGTRLYHFGGEPHPDTAGIRQRFGLVSSEIQERYTHHSWNPPALEVVLSGFFRLLPAVSTGQRSAAPAGQNTAATAGSGKARATQISHPVPGAGSQDPPGSGPGAAGRNTGRAHAGRSQ